MNSTSLIEMAKRIRKTHGGTILSFAIEKDNPSSSYAVVVYAGGKYFVYPEATDISTAALGVLTIMEEFKKIGQDVDYERDVRLLSYQAQMDAPSTVMRTLRKSSKFYH